LDTFRSLNKPSQQERTTSNQRLQLRKCQVKRAIHEQPLSWSKNPWVLGSIPRRPTDQYKHWPATLATAVDLDLVLVILCGADVGP
jgi:hypothetical protein